MKLFTLVMCTLLTVVANAQSPTGFTIIDKNTQCSSLQSIIPGIEKGDCRIEATRIMPGFDLNLQAGTTRFFFDSFFSFPKNGTSISLPIRFVIWEDEKEYNAIQAIVQTAYATRAPLTVIFKNPDVEFWDFSADYVDTERKSSKSCYSTGDMFYCPIKSIQLGSN